MEGHGWRRGLTYKSLPLFLAEARIGVGNVWEDLGHLAQFSGWVLFAHDVWLCRNVGCVVDVDSV